MSFPRAILIAIDRTDRIASAIGRLFLLFQARNSLDIFVVVVETKNGLRKRWTFY